MKKADVCKVVLVLCLLLGGGLRFYGLSRGESALVPGGPKVFYHFHPDEETILAAALHYTDPFAPPLTSYGTPPIYTLRAALALVEWYTGQDDWDLERDPQKLYVVARSLSALVSCLTLWLVWLLGSRCVGVWAGCLAVFCVAVAPLALQQAHFYTVDGLFALLSTASLWATLRALDGRARSELFVLAGVLIGASAAARIIGLIGGIVLAVGFARAGAGKADWLRRPHLWWAALSALITILLLEPYQLAAFLGEDVGGSIHAEAVSIALGERIAPWTLADVHTIPYLHYWTHLWPAGVGWPLTLSFVLGMAYTCTQWPRPTFLLLLWCACYFALIGGLHTKHMRYLMPMLPLLSLLAADACVRLWCARRLVGGVSLLLLVSYTGAYGLAYTRVYKEEDSRLQAGRWLVANSKPSSRIGTEGGGFSLAKVVEGAGFAAIKLEIVPLFRARGYLMCQPAVSYLREQVDQMDYFALVDVNRYGHFTSVPEWYPVLSSFYQKLRAGDLGFVQVARFKTYPSLGGIEFRDDRAGLAYIGFDHPATELYRRLSAREMARVWDQWGRELWEDARCPDQMLHDSVASFRAGKIDEALGQVHLVLDRYPRMRVAFLLEAAIYEQRGDAKSARVALRQYKAAYESAAGGDGLWATTNNISALGLQDVLIWSMSFAPEKANL